MSEQKISTEAEQSRITLTGDWDSDTLAAFELMPGDELEVERIEGAPSPGEVVGIKYKRGDYPLHFGLVVEFTEEGSAGPNVKVTTARGGTSTASLSQCSFWRIKYVSRRFEYSFRASLTREQEGHSETHEQIAGYLDRYDGILRDGQLPVERWNEQGIGYRLTRIANAAGINPKDHGGSSRTVFFESVRALESAGEIPLKVRRQIAWLFTESNRQLARERAGVRARAQGVEPTTISPPPVGEKESRLAELRQRLQRIMDSDDWETSLSGQRFRIEKQIYDLEHELADEWAGFEHVSA